jgi:CubicO group peptidase (beta-lactamase class C family)
MMRRFGIPGLSLAVVDRDGLLFAGAAGTADLVTGAPATTGTQYLWFSMTKVVTATAALRCADEGQLDLDAPADTYLAISAHPDRGNRPCATCSHTPPGWPIPSPSAGHVPPTRHRPTRTSCCAASSSGAGPTGMPSADGEPWVQHVGAGLGFWNVMRLYPQRGLGIAIMTNSTRPLAASIEQKPMSRSPSLTRGTTCMTPTLEGHMSAR